MEKKFGIRKIWKKKKQLLLRQKNLTKIRGMELGSSALDARGRMNPLTAQEVFDKAAVGLLTQKKKSEDPSTGGNGCLYRGPNGTKCAVGFCIEDEDYKEEFDRWFDLKSLIEELPNLTGHYQLLTDLRTIHDCWSVESWKELLQKLAQRYNLSTAKIDSL